MSKEYWAEAMATAVYLKNRSPTKVVKNMTPEECWTGKKPSLQHLKVFGCEAMVHIPKQKRLKLSPKSEKKYNAAKHEVVEEENETHSNEMIIIENKVDVNQADNTDYEEVNPTEANKELRR
ncbi:hypothetical protein QE152_g8967 [Popillia japonica]|uniref:Copia protein n=1 Tax=Popillia japonica TaxID=7064 RepID=A0AAW1LWF1_POPJA